MNNNNHRDELRVSVFCTKQYVGEENIAGAGGGRHWIFLEHREL
jgi:hypothetical protein